MKKLIAFFIFFLLLNISLPLFAESIESIWSPLTDIEKKALLNAQKAESGNADALLNLAIMASGNVRTQKDFEHIQTIIHQFVARHRPEIQKEKNHWRKGFILFSAMHNDFFNVRSSKDELNGYRAEQSQLTEIFRQQTYNCISSSLLYLILARYFDLSVKAVVLPSHSFVQLMTPEGQIIEIETTSISGYGLRHDQAFYKNSASQWAYNRNLVEATYNDYLNRSIISPYQLIADNMNHQHTSPKRLPQKDRYRLSELRAWLLPDNPEAQRNRLYVFNNELIRLKEKKDKKALNHLLLIMTSVVANYEKLKNNKMALDDSTMSIIRFYYTTRAELLLANEQYIAAIEQFDKALKWASNLTDTYSIKQNISVAWLNAGNTFFKIQDYKSAINYYDKAYNRSISPKLKAAVDGNMASAYWNMSIPHLNSGDSLSAFEILTQCRDKYPHIKQCQQKIETICRSYALPQCQ